MMSNAEKYTRLIKEKAEKFGFDGCGISQATFLEEEALRLENYLKNNYNDANYQDRKSVV